MVFRSDRILFCLDFVTRELIRYVTKVDGLFYRNK